MNDETVTVPVEVEHTVEVPAATEAPASEVEVIEARSEAEVAAIEAHSEAEVAAIVARGEADAAVAEAVAEVQEGDKWQTLMALEEKVGSLSARIETQESLLQSILVRLPPAPEAERVVIVENLNPGASESDAAGPEVSLEAVEPEAEKQRRRASHRWI